jgi:hypothetical protein
MAFHEQHPYLGVFFFLAIFGGLAFLQFYRFGYISAKQALVGSTAILGTVVAAVACFTTWQR